MRLCVPGGLSNPQTEPAIFVPFPFPPPQAGEGGVGVGDGTADFVYDSNASPLRRPAKAGGQGE